MKTRSLTTPYMLAGCIVFLMMAISDVSAGETSDRNWHFNINTAYSSRTLSGTLANKTAVTDNAFGNLVATGDSMNVGSSDSLMLALGVQYKRWGLGLNYLPTSFSGQGSALVDLGGSQVGVRVKTPLNTDIDVTMWLGSLFYNFIQTKNMVFGIGVGFGQTSIDLNIIPDVGNPIIYNGEQPFGFINLHMANTYKRFLYGFSINGISATFDGANVNYSDYKIDLGYRIIDKKVKFDVVGGYRMVNFAIDIEDGPNVVAADVTLEGPFLGVTLSY
jgi:hypothetical protein